MARVTPAIQQFSGGIISKEVFGRTDQEALLKGGEAMTNWLPKPGGQMQARPGFERMATGASASRLAPFKDFVNGASLLEFRDATLRIWRGDARITRAAATMSITEGEFDNSLAGWTTATPGASSIASTGNNLVLTASADDYPTAEQEITVAAGTHAVKIVVLRGPVRFRVGSTSGDDDHFGSSLLDTGEHHLQWVSTGASFFIQFASVADGIQRIVDSIAVAPTGDVSVATPWAAADLSALRFQQIGDIIFVGMNDGTTSYQPRKIERRANDSWSVVKYETDDGPFQNVFEHPETMALTATSGNTTLTASGNIFRSTHVGALFQLTHNTQTVTDSFSANGATSDYVRITGGTADDRTIDYTIDFTSGSFVGTIVVERAFGDPVSYNTWQTHLHSGGDIDTQVDETNDDRIVFVRMRVTAYTSGTAAVTLFAPQGETLGVVRVTAVASATSASVEVLTEAGDTTAVNAWREGTWSDANLWPAVPLYHGGRLWWLGSDQTWGSVSDDFYNFDEETEGDSAPISRRIGGEQQDVQWALSLQKLMIGTSASEHSGKASSFDEPITRDAFTITPISTVGSASVQAVAIDGRGFFMDKDGIRPWVIVFDPDLRDYSSVRLDFLTENLLAGGVKEIAVQRRPHTRVWYLTNDGRLFAMLYEPAEQVQGFCEITADGVTFKSIAVEPETSSSDSVWVVAERGGSAVIWRMFAERDAIGGDVNKMADDAVTFTALGSATMTGLDHLDGEFPALWIDGAQVAPSAVVASGSYVHSATVTNAIAGRPYTSYFKGVKAAFGSQTGTALTKRKRIEGAALVATDTCIDGLRVGIEDQDQEYVTPIDPIINYAEVAAGTVHSQLDYELKGLQGSYGPDPRLVIYNIAPNPATILAVVLDINVQD